MNPDNVDVEMAQVFVNEVREILSNLNTNLVALEKEPSDEDAIAEIMRATHTLKGLFAAMGFERIGKVCHIAEDGLESLSRAGAVDSDSLDILFSFLNKMEKILTFLTNLKVNEFSANRNLDEMEEFGIPVLETDLKTLTTGMVNIGAKFRCLVAFDKGCKLIGARAFQVLRELENIAKILNSKPSKDDIEEGVVFSELEISLISQEPEKSIRETIETVDEIADVQLEMLSLRETGLKRKGKEVSGNIQSVRVQLSHLDQMMDLLGELVIERNALDQQLAEAGIQSQIFTQLDRTILDLRRLILKTRLVRLEYIFEHLPRLVREATKGSNKKVELIVSGKQIEVDRTSIDFLNEAIIHLIRNSIDHGIEPLDVREKAGKREHGVLQVIAKIDRNDVMITIEDDGNGIDIQSLREKAIKDGYISKSSKIDREGLIALLFLSGFSTSKQVTKLSGRGIGLNIAYTNITEKLNGSINVETQKGKGTRFTLRVPVLLSIMEALIVEVEDRIFTIPMSNIHRIYRISDEKLFYHNGRPLVVVNKEVVPVVSIKEIFELGAPSEKIHVGKTFESYTKNDKDKIVIIWEQAGKFTAVLVDSILSQQQIVLKKMDSLMAQVKGFSGFTLIGEGTIVPIIDPTQLIDVRGQ